MSDLIERYRKLYAGVIYDAMVFDLKYQEPFVLDRSIAQLTGPEEVMVGRAFTCHGKRIHSDNPDDADAIRLDVFEAIPADSVIVMDTGGDREVAHFGDISAMLAQRAGAAGVVIDGYTRDARQLNSLQFPVFGRGVQPHDAYGWWALYQHSVTAGLPAGHSKVVRVCPEEIVFADQDGVLVIPQHLVLDVLKAAEKRADSEAETRRVILAGERPTDIYRRLGRW